MRAAVLVLALALSILAAPVSVEAQTPGRMSRLGLLVVEPCASNRNIAAFSQALRDLGYREGQTVIVECRRIHGREGGFPELAAELVQLKVDVIAVSSTPGALAAKNATRATPIVFVAASDPVGSGLVASLARPGGNITGLSLALSEGFAGKWVELLKEAAPNVSRVAVLRVPANPVSAAHWSDIESPRERWE